MGAGRSTGLVVPAADPRGKRRLAIFVTTPRANHAKKLFDYASRAEECFSQKLTADATNVFSREQLDRIREDLKGLHGPNEGEAIFNQEYFCCFDAAVVGSYYGT